VKKEEREFCIYFYRSREKHQISRTHPRLRVIGKNKHWWARDYQEKLNKKRRGEGRLSLERKGRIETLIHIG